ncbi:MAG: polyketide synthase dehydratase domain-containing protein, partial [Aestuariivirga sp.]|nr:polyketide synthase dehydratase domain-containing protein [Aestuariivirga sp.]
MVPPNRNFSTPNPSIPFDALGIRVPTGASAFPTDPSLPRLAVVNSFGFGGPNASALIEEFRPARQNAPAQQAAPAAGKEARPVVVPLSSGGKNALALWAGRLASEVKEGQLAGLSAESIADALWQRDHMAERAALVIPPETDALATALTAVAEGRSLDQAPQGPFVLSGHSAGRPRLALAFSGQGGQWWAMSRRLLQEESVFRRMVGMVDEALRPHMGWSLIEEMMRDEATSRINEADRTQGSIFACQIGLYEMWKARGIVPELLIGHSFGEIAATYVAGVLDLDTVARIIAARGRIPFGSTRRGAMATLGLTVEQLLPLLPEDGSAVIAAFNGPVAQTIAGMEGSVERLMKLASEQYPDAVVRRMTMNFGWHSEHLDDCEAAFRSAVGEVSWKDASVPIVSTVTGVFQTRFDLDYWWDNLRQPVSYTKAVGFCLDYGIETFLEIGPHRTLTPLIRGIAQERERSVTAVNSLDRKEDDYATLARAEAQLFVRGVDLAPPPAAGAGLARGRLPKMPWANQHLSSLTPTAQRFMFEVPRHPLLGTRDPGPEPRWTNELLLPNYRYIADHRVNGDTLFPAVGYLEVMGAALRDQHGAGPVEIRDFRIHDALSLATDDIITMRTELDPRSGRIRIFTEHRGAGDGWRLRAEGYGWRHDYALAARPEVASPDTAAHSVPPAAFYGVTRRFGLEYGPQFRPVEAVWRSGENRMRARLSRPTDALSSGYFAFPGTFDGILQACILFGVPAGQEENQDDTAAGAAQLVLPVGARRILLARPLTPSLWVEAGRSGSRFDFQAYDDQGESLLVIEGLETRDLGKAAKAAGAAGEVYTERFEPAAPVGAAERKHWLLLSDDDEAAARLATAFAAKGASLRRAPT